jgi:hypothetical protein
MADKKISALTAATTPLAGTEVLPIVQSSATVKVSVANLTAGRLVSCAGVSSSDTVGLSPQNVIGSGNGYAGNSSAFSYGNLTLYDGDGASVINCQTNLSGAGVKIQTVGVTRLWAKNTGDVDFSTGNLIQGTAAKGVNFSANTPAAGMTSQLLNWYEEGTWTPAQGGGLTVVGAFSSTGRYTRIGRQVTVSGTVTGATSVAVAAAGIVTTNLPFTVVTAGHGNATDAAVNASAAVICTTTNVTSASAIAATGTITFSATYFV